MRTGVAIKPRQRRREKHIQCVAAELFRSLEQGMGRRRGRVVGHRRHRVGASVIVTVRVCVLAAGVVHQVRRMCGAVCEDVVGGMRMCSVVQVITTSCGLLSLQCSSTCAQGDATRPAAGRRRSYEHWQVCSTIA